MTCLFLLFDSHCCRGWCVLIADGGQVVLTFFSRNYSFMADDAWQNLRTVAGCEWAVKWLRCYVDFVPVHLSYNRLVLILAVFKSKLKLRPMPGPEPWVASFLGRDWCWTVLKIIHKYSA
jgi:hypothetical protein